MSLISDKYIKFIDFAFKNGFKDVSIKDMPFAKYMLERIIEKKIFNDEEISAYAYLIYGNILYDFFNDQKEEIEKSYYKSSQKYLLLAEKKSTTEDITNRSRYFLLKIQEAEKVFKNRRFGLNNMRSKVFLLLE